MVPRVEQIPSDRLAGELRAKIAAGEWAAGEQLPSVARLAATYGVARNTASKAVHALAAEQLVRIVRGWGTFVV